MLRIVADPNIPALHAAFGALGRIREVPGHEITSAVVHEADVLLVRSVTPIDARLLAGSSVQFVGSATAGADHVDQALLAGYRIAFAHAPGSNATSVVEWVLAALLATATERGEGLGEKTLGVVGAGEVGGRLIARARALGMRVVVSDPPLAARVPEAIESLDLDALLEAADIVCLHAPLTTGVGSSWPTMGLLDTAALKRMKPGAWLLNAARGRIVEGEALIEAIDTGRVAESLLDVWPNEPSPDPGLVARSRVATPHVAGYSFDGKITGTVMLARALRQWLSTRGEATGPWDAEGVLAPDAPLIVDAPPPAADDGAGRAAWLDALARQAYDIREDTARFQAAMGEASAETRADAFAELRRTYPVRREWARYHVRGEVPSGLRSAVTDGLGMIVDDA